MKFIYRTNNYRFTKNDRVPTSEYCIIAKEWNKFRQKLVKFAQCWLMIPLYFCIYSGKDVILSETQKVIGVYCNNCNPLHKFSSKECELVLDFQKHIVGVLLELNQPITRSSTQTIKEGLNLLTIIRQSTIIVHKEIMLHGILKFLSPKYQLFKLIHLI